MKFDEFVQRFDLVIILKGANVLVYARFRYAHFLRNYFDRYTAVDSLQHGLLPASQFSAWFGHHLELQNLPKSDSD